MYLKHIFSRMSSPLRGVGGALVIALALVACEDDDFTDTIFNTDPTIDYLDQSLFTFPLDTFCKKEFLEPYNVDFAYKFSDKASDKTKQLTPARYDKSVDLAVLSKYLWFDVYTSLSPDSIIFLKKYAPRILSLTGSKNYNQGSETLGDASGGIKVNLYNVNNLDPNNVDMMNEYFFKTMHHEFAHILDQTYLRPTSFNTISNSQYDASGWTDASDSLKAGLGFPSAYASSAVGEDWAEALANYVTRDTSSWESLLGAASFEWEEVDCDSRTEYNKLLTAGANRDTIGYYKTNKNGEGKIVRKKCARNADGTVALNDDGEVVWLHETGIDGRAVILQKVDLVRQYLMEHYKISLDALRHEVQTRLYRTNADGTFQTQLRGVYDDMLGVSFPRYVPLNRLTETQASGMTLMDELREQVYKYKK